MGELGRASGGDLEQIQLLLGHHPCQRRWMDSLGARQNLTEVVNDRLGFVDESESCLSSLGGKHETLRVRP